MIAIAGAHDHDRKPIAFTDTQAGKLWKTFFISAQGGQPVETLPEQEAEVDAHWSPDGKKIVFGRVPFLPGSSKTIAIYILDPVTKEISKVPAPTDCMRRAGRQMGSI